MKTILNTQQERIITINELFEDASYFMEYAKEIVMQVLTGKIDMLEMNRQIEYVYEIAQQDSEAKDERYENGSLGRPGIMDGGPNEIQYFRQERDRCIEILEQLVIKI